MLILLWNGQISVIHAEKYGQLRPSRTFVDGHFIDRTWAPVLWHDENAFVLFLCLALLFGLSFLWNITLYNNLLDEWNKKRGFYFYFLNVSHSTRRISSRSSTKCWNSSLLLARIIIVNRLSSPGKYARVFHSIVEKCLHLLLEQK